MRRGWWLLPALLLAGVTGGGVGLLDQRFIFFPESTLEATPAAAGLAYEEVLFPAADGVQLHGWLVPGEPGWPLVLFAHGNAGNISHRVDNLRQLRELGLATFIFDYRGYGRSAGTPSEAGTYADIRGALAWLRNRGWEPERMIYFGRSLGAAVALQAALEQPPAALVLESPFTSVAAMGWHHQPLQYALFGWWAIDARYDNLDKIGALACPLLLFHGERDDIVPLAMGRRLFERAPQPKTFHPIPGAGHNDTLWYGGAAYWERWRSFVDRLLPDTAGNN